MTYNKNIQKGKIMRGWNKVLIVLLVSISIGLNAGEKEKIIKTNADIKAKSFVIKWVEPLELNKTQIKKVYRLRYEMSVALQLIYLQYADKPEILLQFADEAKNDFHVGLKKLLTPQQSFILNEMKKEILEEGYAKSNISKINIAETKIQ